MPTSRPFAFNINRINISGTYNIGDLCVINSPINFSNPPGGLSIWNGPDEELGYCIGKSVTTLNQPTPIGNIGNVGFWRTNGFSDSAFLNLVNTITVGRNNHDRGLAQLLLAGGEGVPAQRHVEHACVNLNRSPGINRLLFRWGQEDQHRLSMVGRHVHICQWRLLPFEQMFG